MKKYILLAILIALFIFAIFLNERKYTPPPTQEVFACVPNAPAMQNPILIEQEIPACFPDGKRTEIKAIYP